MSINVRVIEISLSYNFLIIILLWNVMLLKFDIIFDKNFFFINKI